MTVKDYCTTAVVVTERTASVVEAARKMRAQHVGTLIVVEQRGGDQIPIGILTDRDLVVEVLAQDVSPPALAVGDVMSTELLTADEHDDVLATLTRMRGRGARRIPIVNARGALVGILTADDLVEVLADALMDLATVAHGGIRREQRLRQ